MYDVIFIGDKNFHQETWKEFKSQFPTLKSAKDLADAKKISMTKMFWVLWPDIVLNSSFDFNYVVDNWSTDYVHVFKNGNTYDGVCLIPKTADITERELQHRFFRNKKEVDILASTPRPYDVFHANTYEEYLNALQETKQDLFWVIPNYVNVSSDFDFTWTIDHHNQYDRKINHVFLNGNYHDGVILCSKRSRISAREWQFKFIANKKEHNIIASYPKDYDVVFISYQEPDADQNFEILKKKVSNAKRIHGVKGIHNAHIEAAKLCNTPMIWIVDGDAQILDDFNFNYQVPAWQYNHVHVWRSKNPINGLIYGYGGVKLFPRQLTIDMDINKPDMTTSISDKFIAVKEISNITGFNTGEFETWKSAFRECAKLASRVIDRQKDEETERRLKIWCSVGREKPFGEFSIAGARAGMTYGQEHKNNTQALALINDFNWLKDRFDGNL